MSFVLSLQSEMLKTKRTASVWMSIAAAVLIPAFFFFAYLFKADEVIPYLKSPWKFHFGLGWKVASVIFLPMYIILICALIPQIEFRNNTWKQVYSLPQSIGQIFFSKFLVVQLMILFCYSLFVICMIFLPVLNTVINNKFPFLDNPVPWDLFMRLSIKIYISILGISALQFWLSLRFKSFIGPIGIGIGLYIASGLLVDLQWKYANLIPFSHVSNALLSLREKPNAPLIESQEWCSIGYFLFFTLIGYLDLKFRNEKC